MVILRWLLLAALFTGHIGHCAENTAASSVASPKKPIHLHIVGGLANVHQYQRHEVPFWTERVQAITGGRVTADIVPSDKAGVPGNEILRLMSAGAMPFGTALLGVSSSTDPEFGAIDLAGLNPDMATLRGSTQLLRPQLERILKERYGLRLLSLYAYPAQILFCRDRFTSLKDLAGRRVRTATPSQSDFFEALGAIPVRTPFTDMLANLNSGNASCAVTGSMSGNTVGLHKVTRYLSPITISWGMSLFAANEEAWQALPSDIREVLVSELGKLERDVWSEADRETKDGINCNVGAGACVNGTPGQMVLVPPAPDDLRVQAELFERSVLPNWFMRCGAACKQLWSSRANAPTASSR
jgi:TRAP-type C4-dicarboxylate transport system substrate-binding protein